MSEPTPIVRAAARPPAGDILERILATTRDTVARARREVPPAALRERPLYAAPRRDFLGALRAAATPEVPALIAEIKRASPSKGLIRADFDPPALARAYRDGGAACLSILTDEPYFQGSLAFLEAVRTEVEDVPPLLRKDFIIDSYQLHEARAHGADAVLLIVGALEDGHLRDLLAEARELGLAALVEAYDEAEVERALAQEIELLGINNRNLRDFAVDMGQTERAFRAVEAAGRAGTLPLVSESGIATHADVRHLRALGASAILVGESLMRQPDVRRATAALLGGQ
jgi:indole-3-glycerol phosphate synthase